MKKSNSLLLVATAIFMSSVAAQAKQGAPHTVSVVPNYSTVNISWQAPESAKQLKWHDDEDYDGDAGRQISPQKPAQLYIASEFTPTDLTSYVGESIVSVNYFEYRPTVKVTALIYEDGRIVRQADFDLKTPAFKANSIRTVTFDEPYVIPAGKTVRVALRIEHGSNFDFVAIMNRKAHSKGDLISYDGQTWSHNGRGTYLITANLKNDVDEAPTGYNIYADGKKVNESLLTDLSASVTNQTNGRHTYMVEAVYAGATYGSQDKVVDIKGSDLYFPAISTFDIVTEGVNGLMEWHAPLLRGSDNLLSWTNNTLANSIGGTASSNTKVWVKNDFAPADLISFIGSDISALNVQFHEKVLNSMIIYIMKDGKIVQYDTIAPERLSEITIDTWQRLPYSKPVTIEAGSKYSYGYYLMHTPKTHPVSVDNGIAVGSKGNSFSTSSPNSKDFANSKPSWKTLASGGIAGNWLMTAEVSGGTPYTSTLTGYNLYRNGELIAQNLTKAEYEDEVPAPGLYTYGVEALGTDGKSSQLFETEVQYTLPESYRAPLISEASADDKTGEVTLKWGMDVELRHYGTPTYKVGFDEAMTMAYGSRFTATELADYQGYKITKLTFIVGEAIPEGFKLEIYNGAGTILSSTQVNADAVTPLALYTLTLDKPVEITGQEDLILAYNATLPAGSSPIVLDGGPLVAGGSVVKLAGMDSWLNLGTINSTYNNYNIVIGAIAGESNATGAPKAEIELGTTTFSGLQRVVLSADDLRTAATEDNVQALQIAAPAPRTALMPKSYNVYRNGVLVGNTTERSYKETLTAYDVYTYTVSAVYPNGWESAQSDPAIISHGIDQLGRAPYDLRLNADHNGLIWEAAEDAPTLTYAIDGASYGVGMTGSGERETFAVHKYPADSLKNVVGQKISHIKFALYSTELNYAAIVIFRNQSVVYEQEVPVSSLVTITSQEGGAYNTIRLNEPFEITEGDEIMIGYHITYANGIKPMIFDAGPADDGLGNLLSASGTSWKTLKSMNNSLDGNWRIYAFLQSPNGEFVEQAPRQGTAPTYNVYLNSQLLKDNITGKTFIPEGELLNGTYTVTAVKDGKESAPSNQFLVQIGGVSNLDVTDLTYYDSSSATLVVKDGVAGTLYNIAGIKIADITGNYDMSSSLPGVYFFIPTEGKALKFVR